MTKDTISIDDFVGHTMLLASGKTKNGDVKKLKADIYFRSGRIFYDIFFQDFIGHLTYDSFERAVAKYNEL